MKNTKEEIKIGDRVQWKACPTIKSKVKSIKPSRWNEKIMIYRLENNCIFQKHEIRKI